MPGDPGGDGFAIGAAVVRQGIEDCPTGIVVERILREDALESRLFYAVSWPVEATGVPALSFAGVYRESELGYAP